LIDRGKHHVGCVTAKHNASPPFPIANTTANRITILNLPLRYVWAMRCPAGQHILRNKWFGFDEEHGADRACCHGRNDVNECAKLMTVDYWSPFMTTPSNRQQAIALLEKLQDDRLPDAIAALEALNQPVNRTASAEEVNLIRLINLRPPIVQRQRLEVLRDRLEAETLTEDEREELLAMTEVVEMQDAERARAMFELATLRGVDLTVIVREFRGAIAVG
jgi:hypothetical protein